MDSTPAQYHSHSISGHSKLNCLLHRISYRVIDDPICECAVHDKSMHQFQRIQLQNNCQKMCNIGPPRLYVTTSSSTNCNPNKTPRVDQKFVSILPKQHLKYKGSKTFYECDSKYSVGQITPVSPTTQS